MTSGDEQDESGEAEDEDGDDGFTLQDYTPNALFSRGQFELKLFNQVYTQKSFYDAEGDTQPLGVRGTYFASIFNFTYGIKPRFNVGLDVWTRSVRIGDTTESPFAVLQFQNQAPNTRTAVTNIGPRIKFIPFIGFPEFSGQSSFLFPVASDPEGKTNGQPFLDFEDFLWWTQLFYAKSFSDFQFFAEIDLFWRIDRNFRFKEDPNDPTGNSFATPVSIFYSWFPTSKITLYAMSQWWPTYGEGFINNWYIQSGLGGKYQLTRNFELEFMYTRFWIGVAAAGPANTFNLGLRFVRL